MKPGDIKLLKRLRDRVCGTSISPCTPYMDVLDRAIAELGEDMLVEIRLMNPDDTLDHRYFAKLVEQQELSAPDCQYWVVRRAE